MNKKRLILSALVAISSLSLHPASFGDVPNLINYQGRLRDNATGSFPSFRPSAPGKPFTLPASCRWYFGG